MSQARNAVLAAAMPMQTKANAIQLAYRQMKSRTSRRTRASELNACDEIPDLSCMGPAASVRGGRRDWQGRQPGRRAAQAPATVRWSMRKVGESAPVRNS